MEIKQLKIKLSKLIFKESSPFVSKPEVNWPFFYRLGVFILLIIIFGILIWPTCPVAEGDFHEKAEPGVIKGAEFSPNDTFDYLQQPKGSSKHSSGTFDYLSRGSSSQGSSQNITRNGPMILTPKGFDVRNQLPPGTRIPLKLNQKATVSVQGMPVMAVVVSDVVQGNDVAIPEGSLCLGEISFDDSMGRAQVSWRTLHLPDGRERQIAGLAASSDGQIGIEGTVHSDSFKNTAGQLASRFISAFAEGSMPRGSLGASPGGYENGFKNAIAETAKDRGDIWADDLKKQKKWIEIDSNENFIAILTQPLTFRDPGTLYGQ